MSINLSEYLPKIRRLIQDEGDSEHEEFLGDGYAEEFYLTAAPIKSGSVTVYLDDVQNESWSLDYTTGQLLFGTAPSSNVIVKILYTSYLWSDTDLVEYLEDAIQDSMDFVEDVFTIGGTTPYSYIDTAPEGSVLNLWLLILQRRLLLKQASNMAKESISWRAEEMSVNRTQLVSDMIKVAGELDKQIEKAAWRINNKDLSGLIVAGGEVPDDYSLAYGESYIIEWQRYR